jgi:hypothetical protein
MPHAAIQADQFLTRARDDPVNRRPRPWDVKGFCVRAPEMGDTACHFVPPAARYPARSPPGVMTLGKSFPSATICSRCTARDARSGRRRDESEDFARYCIDAFDRLYAEGATLPRMMSIGLHLRIIGKAGRIAGLERLLAHIAGHRGVWFARLDEVAHAWRAGTGLPDWTPKHARLPRTEAEP